MKKVLEGELLSIAHRVLKMKDADVDKLYIETKELYEKLQVLKFYQDNFSLGLIKDITENELVEKLENQTESRVVPIDETKHDSSDFGIQEEEKVMEERSQMPEELTESDYPIVVDAETELDIIIENVTRDIPSEEISEPIITQDTFTEEKTTDATVDILEENTFINENSQKDIFQKTTSSNEAIFNEEVLNKETIEIKDTVAETTIVQTEINTLNDHLEGFNYAELEFIRVENIPVGKAENFTDFSFEKIEKQLANESEKQHIQNVLFNVDQVAVTEPKIIKTKSLNDIYSSTIQIGLNDRIAFEKHLFNNSSEDFNRVLSQLNTVSTFDEAMSFIDHLVKPEYNNWEGKEEYATRFLELIEKRFV